jgi:probable HAF family extracellular repeat protein
MTPNVKRSLPLIVGITLIVSTSAIAQPVPIDLGTLGGTFSFPSAINDKGEVVGRSTTVASGISTHAFVWTARTGMIDLGTLGGATSRAAAVNNHGQVAG